MAETQVVIGVDGGGTKTNIVCLDHKTRAVIGRAKTTSTNWNSVGAQVAKKTLIDGINDCLADAKCSTKQVVAIGLGMSGVDRPEDKKEFSKWIMELLPHLKIDLENPKLIDQISICNDAIAALASGTEGDLFGVVVISGTGSIGLGFDEKGNTTRSGGWGALLGEECSGYSIGSQILAAVVKAHDGRGPKTLLTDAVLKQLNLTDPWQLISWCYHSSEGTAWARIASVAPCAYEAAEKGDIIAKNILDAVPEQIVGLVTPVVNKLNLESCKSFPVVLAGGHLTREDSPVAKGATELLKKTYGDKVQVKIAKMDPAEAMALLVSNHVAKSK